MDGRTKFGAGRRLSDDGDSLLDRWSVAVALHGGIDEVSPTLPMHARPGTRRDRGFTLIEIVIGVALMGLVVGGTMTLLGTTIRASRLDRDHSNAHAWLQTASDMLYARDPDPVSYTHLTLPTILRV